MKKIVTLLATSLLAAVSMNAQSFQSALFLDGYRLGYRYNPALQNENSFLSVGQLESQTRNNVGAASFLYPRGEELVTALHSSVPAQEFLGSLKDNNTMGSSLNYSLFSYGWRKGASYQTAEVGVRAAYKTNVPKDIFSILKLGTGETNYDLGGLGLNGNLMVELAYGYSHKLADWVSVGARAKLLLGINFLDYTVTRMDVYMAEDKYKLDLEARLDLTSRLSKIHADKEGYLDLSKLSQKDRWKLPSGVGLAVDLGAVFTPAEGLTMSVSLLDLGGVFWYFGNAGKSQGSVTFSGMDSLTMEDIREGNFRSRFDDELSALLSSLKIKELKSRTSLEMIPFHVNGGIRYDLPFYRALSIGATGNYLHMSGFTYAEGRGALAWNPRKWLGITLNGGVGTYGPVWGAALNAAVWKFRLTLGYCDGFGGTIPYTSTPLKPNNKTVTLGLTFDL